MLTYRSRNFTCSMTCKKIKTSQTSLSKYGVKHPMQARIIRLKQQQTMIKRHGVSQSMFLDKFKHRQQATILKKYGVTNATQIEQVQAKRRQTNRKRYGVEYPGQNEQIKAKEVQINLNKHEALRQRDEAVDTLQTKNDDDLLQAIKSNDDLVKVAAAHLLVDNWVADFTTQAKQP